jgi:hypothetical protein
MAMTMYEIDSYRVFHMVDSFGQSAIIHCYKDGVVKGGLFFYKDGMTIPQSSRTSSGLTLNFQEKHLAEVLGTLRLEKPLFVWLNDSSSRPYGGLSTSDEPVGEEET